MAGKAHPQQPLHFDRHGVIRFRANKLIRRLLDVSSARGYGLNEMWAERHRAEDMEQLYQLIGFSVSGAGFFNRRRVQKWDRQAASLLAKRRKSAKRG